MGDEVKITKQIQTKLITEPPTPTNSDTSSSKQVENNYNYYYMQREVTNKQRNSHNNRVILSCDGIPLKVRCNVYVTKTSGNSKCC